MNAKDAHHDGWRDAQRILCVRLDNLGDVLMTTPAMRALRDARAGRAITLLASGSGAAVARLVPDVDEVIAYDAPWVKHAQPAPVAADIAIRETLEARSFDAAVIFTVYSQSALPAALLCRMAGIPLRLAYARENPYSLLTHWVAETEPGAGIRHEVQRQLDLVAEAGAPCIDPRLRLVVPERARRAIADRIRAARMPKHARLIVLHPGATAASRRYPAELYGRVARALTECGAAHVFVTGGSAERALTATVCAATQVNAATDLAGELDLAELGALIARADVLVSNNSGPVHIAAALGTPVVDLYALTNPQHTPWHVPHRVLFHDVPCKYCYKSVCHQGHHDCLRRIEPGKVVEAVRALLAGSSGAGSARQRCAQRPRRVPTPALG